MPSRAPTLQTFSEETGETLVTFENYWQALTKADPLNSTAIGRGRPNVQVGLNQLVSLTLAAVSGDLKNCVERVKAFSGLLRSDMFVATRHPQNLLSETSAVVVSIDDARESIIPEPNKTLFDVLSSLAQSVAVDPDGLLHQQMQKGLEITITTSSPLSAEIRLWVNNGIGGNAWENLKFTQPQTEIGTGSDCRFARQCAIGLPHIEMMAKLYADTLKNTADGQKEPPAKNGAGKGNVSPEPRSKNENAALPGAALTRQDYHRKSNSGLLQEQRKPMRDAPAGQALCGGVGENPRTPPGRVIRKPHPPSWSIPYEQLDSCPAFRACARAG